MEALARCTAPGTAESHRPSYPDGEKNRLISGWEWTLFHACEQTRRWHDSGLPPVKWPSISPSPAARTRLLQGIRKILDETRLSPRFLEVELTESGAMENVQESGELIRNLHARGISIAIDDFGTGYSSMQQLVRVPINVLKIDKSFVDDLPESIKSTTLARLIINMAKSLDMEVVAEGVENIKQYTALRQMESDLLQGFFLSRPLEPLQFEGLLRVNAWEAAHAG
jgi:EAL domain-containing protein (putative c-di-GMP-specific phosphodiesterase class I)